MKKKRKKDEESRDGRKAKRSPPLHVPLPFDQAMKGLLTLSPADAKAAREAADKKKRKG